MYERVDLTFKAEENKHFNQDSCLSTRNIILDEPLVQMSIQDITYQDKQCHLIRITECEEEVSLGPHKDVSSCFKNEPPYFNDLSINQ